MYLRVQSNFPLYYTWRYENPDSWRYRGFCVMWIALISLPIGIIAYDLGDARLDEERILRELIGIFFAVKCGYERKMIDKCVLMRNIIIKAVIKCSK